MASFSIHDLLGLNKASSKSNASDGGANRKQNDGAAKGEDDHVDIDVESLHEDSLYDAAHQLVTVEVRTMRHASSVNRSSSSRKRKRTEPAQERDSTPDTDGEWEARNSSTSPGYSAKRPDSKSSKRLRTAFTTAQLRTLEYFFRVCPYPDSYGREQIARATGIDDSKIQVWFQNRRARYRKREKPMEPHKSPVGQIPATSPSTLSPHSMMQAYFTAAAALSGSKLPATTAPSHQHLYPPGHGSNHFFSTGFAAMPPFPPFFTYPASSVAAVTPAPAPVTQPSAAKEES